MSHSFPERCILTHAQGQGPASLPVAKVNTMPTGKLWDKAVHVNIPKEIWTAAWGNVLTGSQCILQRNIPGHQLLSTRPQFLRFYNLLFRYCKQLDIKHSAHELVSTFKIQMITMCPQNWSDRIVCHTHQRTTNSKVVQVWFFFFLLSIEVVSFYKARSAVDVDCLERPKYT